MERAARGASLAGTATERAMASLGKIMAVQTYSVVGRKVRAYDSDPYVWLRLRYQSAVTSPSPDGPAIGRPGEPVCPPTPPNSLTPLTLTRGDVRQSQACSPSDRKRHCMQRSRRLGHGGESDRVERFHPHQDMIAPLIFLIQSVLQTSWKATGSYLVVLLCCGRMKSMIARRLR